MMRLLSVLAVAALCAGLSGCNTPTVCPSDLRLHVSPAERTIAVGESFTATAEALGCGGTRRLSEAWVWRVADTAVVRVDSLSGRITGRAPGSAFVEAHGRTYGYLGAGVQDTVQSAQ